ncbi:actin-related protein [Mycena floridula]|nr:actin-related protein [Mycena floridula]
MSYRDSTVVILETGRTVIRAGLGLHELLKTPSVEISARVGLRKSATTEGNADESAPSTSQSSPAPAVNDYLVGSALDTALAAGQDISVFWPFAGGDISDWTQAEALWKYVLFNQLGRRRAQNESPVLLSMAAGLARSAYEKVCQLFFERFNVAAFAILERPRSQIYATTRLTGVIVDIGYETTDITCIYENFIVKNATATAPLGIRHCQIYLAHILRSNQSVMAALSPPEAPLAPQELQSALLELVKEVWEAGHVKVPSSGASLIVEDEGITDIAAIVVAGREKAVIESGMRKKATLKGSAADQARAREIEALDLLTVEFRGHSITLGKERHRFCEALFDPTLLNSAMADFAQVIPSTSNQPRLSLQEVVGLAVKNADIDQRLYIWQGLFVTGDMTRHVRGIGHALKSRLAPFIVMNPELHTEVQPRVIGLLNLPEYYPEYRETGEGYAAFLGSSIIAKLIFSETRDRSFVSKVDYSQKGPHAIIETSPSLL